MNKCLRSLNTQYQSGFTLVEIMTVVMIIAVMVALVSVGVGGQAERALQGETQKLFQKIRALSDESLLNGRESGLAIGAEGQITFYLFDEGALRWRAQEEGQYARLIMDSDYKLEWQLDADWTGGDWDDDGKYLVFAQGKTRHQEPDILFFSDGQLSPFTIRLSHRSNPRIAYLIEGQNPQGVQWRMDQAKVQGQ